MKRLKELIQNILDIDLEPFNPPHKITETNSTFIVSKNDISKNKYCVCEEFKAVYSNHRVEICSNF